MKIVLAIFLLLLAACNGPAPDPNPAPVDVVFSTGFIKPANRNGIPFVRNNAKLAPFPDAFSWEDQGIVIPIRDQKSCGSCWAFGSTAQLDFGYKIFAHKDVDFSEQDLVGSMYYGCGGGDLANDRQVKQGQLAESDCPYTASNRRCPSGKPVAGKGASWGMIGQDGRYPTDDEMKSAIMAYGAVVVTVGANNSFMNYKGGYPTSCPSSSTNHMVALTGWKVVNGKTYFKLRNSWGESWGEKGYGWFPLKCWSLGEEAAYIAVDAVPCKAPAYKLPAKYTVKYGDTVTLAVKNVQGVTYEWYRGPQKLGVGAELEIEALEEMVLTLKMHNQCGDAEVKTVVTVE